MIGVSFTTLYQIVTGTVICFKCWTYTITMLMYFHFICCLHLSRSHRVHSPTVHRLFKMSSTEIVQKMSMSERQKTIVIEYLNAKWLPGMESTLRICTQTKTTAQVRMKRRSSTAFSAVIRTPWKLSHHSWRPWRCRDLWCVPRAPTTCKCTLSHRQNISYVRQPKLIHLLSTLTRHRFWGIYAPAYVPTASIYAR
jgi:hypothetical protein